VRRRLLVSYLLLIVVVLVGLEVPLGVLFARHERSSLAAEATRDATAISGVAEDRLNGGDRLTIAAFDRLIHGYGDDAHAELTVFDATGRIVVARAGVRPGDIDTHSPRGVADAIAGRPTTGPLQDDGRSWTYAAVPVTAGSKSLGAVLIALPNEDADERIQAAWLLLAGLAVTVIAVAGLVGWRMARWLNEPLAALTSTAAEVGSGRLDVRVPAVSGPPELRTLAEQFNDMVGRIEGLVDGQRRFVADASHQLRTPLTALRLRIENLERPGDDADNRSVEAALDEADRLGRLLDGLLAISRAEGSRPEPAPIDVTAVVVDRCNAWAVLGEEQSVRLSPVLPGGGPETALAVPGHLEQILDNLIANALDVSAGGTSIDIAVSDGAAGVVVTISDHGPGMTADQRIHAFDRFWQGGSESGGRAGLGLAIVHQLVTTNRGRVELDDTPGGGLTARVSLPTAPLAERG
jgi:signal transduction histidine kinase